MRWITTPWLLVLAGRFIVGYYDVDEGMADTVTYTALSFIAIAGTYFYLHKKK
ncbi:MAG: hypothetical protein Q7S87_09900 [Agitococcus sp.]|nr:hypothetical protein [Agitococcus sp.]MDO9177073.1 hypothetical protein [Agitococcus sp.]